MPNLGNGGKSVSYVILSIFLCVYFIILKIWKKCNWSQFMSQRLSIFRIRVRTQLRYFWSWSYISIPVHSSWQQYRTKWFCHSSWLGEVLFKCVKHTRFLVSSHSFLEFILILQNSSHWGRLFPPPEHVLPVFSVLV